VSYPPSGGLSCASSNAPANDQTRSDAYGVADAEANGSKASTPYAIASNAGGVVTRA
jgi:hypothetical protein